MSRFKFYFLAAGVIAAGPLLCQFRPPTLSPLTAFLIGVSGALAGVSLHATAKAFVFPANARSMFDFPELWRLFSYVLPQKTRRRVFEPHYNELVEDFLDARRYAGRWQRRWVVIAFCIRTMFMMLDCFRVAFADQILRLLPADWRNRWVG